MALPRLNDLDAFLSGPNARENLLHVLPELYQSITDFTKSFPDIAVETVWRDGLRPLLQSIRTEQRLRGSSAFGSLPLAPVCPLRLGSARRVVTLSKETSRLSLSYHDAKTTPEPVPLFGEPLPDDPYSWLTERDDPEVLSYLQAENQYADAALAHTKPLQKVLYQEFISRLHESDESAHVMLPDGYAYFSRKMPGAEYKLHCRTNEKGEEEVYLDENQLARMFKTSEDTAPYFNLGFLRHSPDGQFIAYGVDISGNERYAVYLKDLSSGFSLWLPGVNDCSEDFEFSNDGKWIFYVEQDDTERAAIWKRAYIEDLKITEKTSKIIHTGPLDKANNLEVLNSQLLYEEKDEMFYVMMTKSSNKRYIFINSTAQITSETRYIDMINPENAPCILFQRRDKIQYTVEHHSPLDMDENAKDKKGYFYILTNEGVKNNWIFRIPVPDHNAFQGTEAVNMSWVQKHRQTVIEHRDFVIIEAVQVRKRHLITFERSNCVQSIRIIQLDSGTGLDTYHYVSFSDADPVYSLWPGSVDEEVADLSKSTLFATNILRFTYTSFTTPKQVIDYNMDTKMKTVVHEEHIDGLEYDKSLYHSKRLWATGVDGTTIPMSIVYRKDLLNTESGNLLLLHAYGAYGCCIDPIFSTTRLSLLDRGFIFAIAHVRGGSDMGNAWYLEGKLAKKSNTFNDFVSCAEFLIKEGYTNNDKLAIYGRSAGGLLIGAVVNMRPDLFRSVLVEVPFVDAINTMFDKSIPWTAFEFEEWGNPEDPQIYTAIRSYCPYSNIKPGVLYPNMLIVAGMNDPRVAYFEPAKWTARLRATAKWTNENTAVLIDEEGRSPNSVFNGRDRRLLLKLQDAGHSGNSGQYSHLEDLAFEYAFLISSLNASFKPLAPKIADEKYWNSTYANDDMSDDDMERAEGSRRKKSALSLRKLSGLFRPSSGSNSTRSRKGSVVQSIKNLSFGLPKKKDAGKIRNRRELPSKYVQEENSGRVQSSGKMYAFLNKFF